MPSEPVLVVLSIVAGVVGAGILWVLDGCFRGSSRSSAAPSHRNSGERRAVGDRRAAAPAA